MAILSRLFGRNAPARRAGALELRRPWARVAAGEAGTAGAFLTVVNTAAVADRLVAAMSPQAQSVDIQAIRVVGGDIAMRRLDDGLVLPPGTTLTLKPRGYHLLLRDLAPPPIKDRSLPLTLVFERAGSVDLTFVVEDEGPVGDMVLVEEPQRG
jgi:periplasmic copper chaperone A